VEFIYSSGKHNYIEVNIELEGIKMVSGQAGPGQPGPYPMYQPVYQPVRSTSETVKGLVFSNMMIVLVVALGLFLIWLGAVIWGFADDPDVDDIGMLSRAIGMLLLTGMLLLAGLVRGDIHHWIRVMMILSATLLLIFIGFWSGFWSMLSISV